MAGSYLRVWAYAACVWAIVSLAPAAAQLPCVGDCDGDGMVSISELIRGVNISLGSADLSTCPEFDSSGDGMVAINELIQAVNAALQGCVNDQPTATPTGFVMPTDTPSTEAPTATSTPEITDTEAPTETPVPGTPTPDPGEQIAGAGAAVANSLSSIANIVGAVVVGASGGVGGSAVLSGFPGTGAGDISVDACELGGMVTTSITTSGLSANIEVDFENCLVNRSGGSVLFDGNLAVTQLGLNLRGQGSFDARIEFRDGQGQVSAVTDAIIQSPVALTAPPAGDDPCGIDTPLGARLITAIALSNLTGTLSSTVPGEGAAEVTFLGTEVDLEIQSSNEDCVPIEFDLTFNGDAQISQAIGAQAVTSGTSISFALEFVEFVLSATQSGDESLVSMEGDLVASCFGGTVSLSTPESLSLLIGQFCPGSGTIRIVDIGDVVYSQDGVSVGGMTFASCLDPALLTCAE